MKTEKVISSAKDLLLQKPYDIAHDIFHLLEKTTKDAGYVSNFIQRVKDIISTHSFTDSWSEQEKANWYLALLTCAR